MNSILERVLGVCPDETNDPAPAPAGPKPVREDVPVPLATLPRTSFRNRLQARRNRSQRAGPSDIRRVVGEAAESEKEDSLIPADAETLDNVGEPIRKGVRPVRDVVMEPRDPYGEKERLMTPVSALVAPDCTPDAAKPIPPSGADNPTGRFRSKDADREPDGEPDGRTGTLDTILNRAKPPLPREPDAVMTSESAYGLLRVASPAAQNLAESTGVTATGDALLAAGQAMPDHVPNDGRNILEAFRRFNR